MKILIITPVIGHDYSKKVQYGILSKIKYCFHRGYDLTLPGMAAYQQTKSHPQKKFGWTKVYSLLKNINDYDWIFVSDADVLIRNYEIRLEDIINKYASPGTSILITRDQNNLNSGNFLVRGRNPDTLALIKKWYSLLGQKFPYIGVQDQPSLIFLSQHSRFKHMFRVVPQRLFNSYPNIKLNRCSHTYQAGDLLIHYAGFDWHHLDMETQMRKRFLEDKNDSAKIYFSQPNSPNNRGSLEDSYLISSPNIYVFFKNILDYAPKSGEQTKDREGLQKRIINYFLQVYSKIN